MYNYCFMGYEPATELNEMKINPLNGYIKPQSNGPLYSNTVIGTLAVDGDCDCMEVQNCKS